MSAAERLRAAKSRLNSKVKAGRRAKLTAERKSLGIKVFRRKKLKKGVGVGKFIGNQPGTQNAATAAPDGKPSA